MAAIVGDHRPLTKSEKIGWLVFTGIVAFLEICMLNRADKEARKVRAEERQAFTDERNSFDKLLSHAQDQIGNMTGGDSFPYIDISISHPPLVFIPRLMVEGRHPLRNVQLRTVDADRLKQMRSYTSPVSVREWLDGKFKTIKDLPQASPATPTILDETFGVDTNPETDKNYDFEITALNGMWKESLRFRRINDVWQRAFRVVEIDKTKPESEWQERKIEISPGFPLVDGKPDWNS